MPETLASHEGENVVAPEDARLEPQELHEVLAQENRTNEEKSLEFAEKITDAMNEITTLHTQERILQENGAADQADVKHQAASVKQAEVDAVLQHEGFVHDIQKLTSGESRQVLEVILQRMRALDLEKKTLTEAGENFRDDRNVNARVEFWATIEPRIEACQAEYERLIPMKDAVSTHVRETSEAEGKEYYKKHTPPGRLVNVGKIGRGGY